LQVFFLGAVSRLVRLRRAGPKPDPRPTDRIVDSKKAPVAGNSGSFDR
jgi:hypothetical protein